MVAAAAPSSVSARRGLHTPGRSRASGSPAGAAGTLWAPSGGGSGKEADAARFPPPAAPLSGRPDGSAGPRGAGSAGPGRAVLLGPANPGGARIALGAAGLHQG